MARAICQRFPMREESQGQVWSYAPAFRRPRHFHQEPELNLLVSGSATFGIGDSVVRARAGELLVFPPCQDHVLLAGSHDLVLYAIAMRPTLARNVLGAGVVTWPRLRVRLDERTLREFSSKAASLSGEPGGDERVAALWDSACRVVARDEQCEAPPVHSATRRVLQALAGTPEMSRQELARVAHSSVGEISRHFHRDLGVTLVNYRNRLRVMQFAQRAEGQRSTLLSIALESGFGSYAQCHRAFRTTFGCSPRDFLRTDFRQRVDDWFEPLT